MVFFCYDEQSDRQKKSLSFQEKIHDLDILGSILLITGVVCLLLALQWGGTNYSWKSARIISLVLASAILICSFGALQYTRPRSAIIVSRISSIILRHSFDLASAFPAHSQTRGLHKCLVCVLFDNGSLHVGFFSSCRSSFSSSKSHIYYLPFYFQVK